MNANAQLEREDLTRMLDAEVRERGSAFGCGLVWFRLESRLLLGRMRVWIKRQSLRTKKFLKVFYRFGSYASLAVFTAMLFVLCYSSFRALYLLGVRRAKYTEVFGASAQVFSPVVPGVNFPLADLLYLWVALAVGLIVHEAGHAMALAVHGMQAEACGFLLVGPFVPAAFVRFDKEVLRPLNVSARLDVFFGGIWHNVVFSSVCFVLLYMNGMLLNTFTRSIVANNSAVNSTALSPNEEFKRMGFINHGLVLWARQLQYFILVNVSLAGMNSLPIYHFDGQHVVAILMSIWSQNGANTRHRIHLVLRIGTGLLIINLLFSYLTLLF